MANLGTDVLTNPTVVQLHVKMHGFYGDNHTGEFKCMQNAAQSSPEQPRAGQSRPEQPRTAQNSPEQPREPRTAQNSPEQPRTGQSSPEQPRAAQSKMHDKYQAPHCPASYRTAI